MIQKDKNFTTIPKKAKVGINDHFFFTGLFVRVVKEKKKGNFVSNTVVRDKKKIFPSFF